MSTTLSVTPGSTLQINVGGAGGNCTGFIGSTGAGGFGGGGDGGGCSSATGGAGGGGASDVRTGTFTLADRVLVAGGGGGGAGLATAGGNSGSVGGVFVSTPAVCTVTDPTSNCSGAGGAAGSSPGGAGGLPNGGNGGTPTQDQGGDGGAGTGTMQFASEFTGGGGGGGLYGGGGGGGAFMEPFANEELFGPAGGGGGSSLAGGGTLTDGVQSGNGQVTITYTLPASALAETLVTDSTSKAPGTALVDKATAIQTAVNAGQTTIACADITSYLGLVKAQTGKKLTTKPNGGTTGLLTTDATNLAAALGC